jgi:hypothetical protein
MPAYRMAGGALALGACGFAGQAFLQGTPSTSQVTSAVALRGAVQKAAQPTSQPFNALPFAAVAAGTIAAGSLAGTVAAGKRTRVVCNFSKETQIGSQEPLGFFDPAGFCTDETTFKDLRAKEIKHGRLAMMGALGMLTQSLVQLPGMEGVPKGVTACLVGNGQVGFFATLAIIAGLEAAVFVQDPNKEPGNFGNPLPWFDDYSDEMRGKELNNGRIAMFSAIGIIAASLLTGKSAIEQF